MRGKCENGQVEKGGGSYERDVALSRRRNTDQGIYVRGDARNGGGLNGEH